MLVNIKLLENGKMPEKQTSGSSGYDLFAAESKVISPGQVKIVQLGFIIEIPNGYEAQIRSRSGLALNHRLFVLNSPGTIDSDYRKEVGVLLMNLGESYFEIIQHMRIAQMIFSKVEDIKFAQISQTSKTERENGWGSTGL